MVGTPTARADDHVAVAVIYSAQGAGQGSFVILGTVEQACCSGSGTLHKKLHKLFGTITVVKLGHKHKQHRRPRASSQFLHRRPKVEPLIDYLIAVLAPAD